MNKKIMWLVVSALMALSLVMAACGPAVTTPISSTTPTVPTTATTPTAAPAPTAQPTPTIPSVEVPKYGGVINTSIAPTSTNLGSFDPILSTALLTFSTVQTNDALYGNDWAKGPAGGYGTNECDWTTEIDLRTLKTGYVAESWEIPAAVTGDTATVLVHIRKGIHWALNPNSEASRLVGGRELTTEDVVFSLKASVADPRAYVYRANPELQAANVTSPEKWLVKIQFPWGTFENALSRLLGYDRIAPPEVYAKYGTMTDWKVSVGTGPFMLTEYIPGSILIYKKNPSYYMKDPIGPGKGNQLPYIDEMRYLIIPDASTLQAALRTGKVDSLSGVSREDLQQFKKTSPWLLSKKQTLGTADHGLNMRVDKPPFNDIRLRRALMMATDFDAIKNDFFGGDAQIVTFPIPYAKEYADAYYGPDEKGQWPSDTPASVRELYTYNPEKAKQLLKEAGYPNGFKVNISVENRQDYIDYVSIIKDQWSKAGIDVTLSPKEAGIWTTLRYDLNYEGIKVGMAPAVVRVYKMQQLILPGSQQNQSMINDPVVNDTFPKIQTAMVTDINEANRLHRDMMKYLLDQVYTIPHVTSYKYVLWAPWVKNYSGELNLSGSGAGRSGFEWSWIDQTLKKSMGF